MSAQQAATTKRVIALDEVIDLVGQTVGVSSWHEITQEKINAFGALTGDEQWIHTDPERAAAGPFGTTIAHGYLTLCLSTAITFEIVEFTGLSSVVNYGLDKVRFTAPVPSGSFVRGALTIASARWRGRRFMEVVCEIKYEIKDSDEVPCTARVITLLQPEGADG